MPHAALRLTLGAALLATVLGCAGQAFDPAGPCVTDGRAPGAYPDLEAAIPDAFEGRGPDELDSGRSCTPTGLGTLAQRGIAELRYAGGLWRTGGQSGVTLAVFSADGLEPQDMLAFYEAGTSASRRIERVTSGEYRRGGRSMLRLDALVDGSDQTIVVWADAGLVRVALVADSLTELDQPADHELRVEQAVDAHRG
jgi:hypothetical protein